MTESIAPQSLYAFCVTVAAILLAAWVATHLLHDRRLKRFGDPRLLGLAGMWPRRICSGMLLAGSAGALLALVVNAGDRSPLSDRGAGSVLLLVDPPRQSPGTGNAGPAWAAFSRDLRQVAEGIGPVRIAVYLAGSPPGMVVPYTKDVSGALLVLEAGSSGHEVPGTNAVEASVEALRLMSPRAGTSEAASALVVVSSKAEHEIDAVADSLQRWPPVIFVRSVPGGARPVYRREGLNAQWVPLDAPDSPGTLACAIARRGEPAGWQPVQVLALVAFLLLYLEWAVHVSWPARGGVGGHALSSPGFNVSPPVKGSSPGVAVCLLVVMSFAGARHTLGSQSAHAGDMSHLVSFDGIGPHAAVVTEISDDQPYVGQQFSIIYRLRCSVPPVAVDIDPQDFAGFWTVAVQTAAQARPDAVTLNGRAATDFLLRQLIVFPLKPGRQILPALRLKIKQDINSRDEWDLTRQTTPMVVHVKPVPAAEDKRDAFCMVGSLDASVSGADPGGSQEAVLEVEGTANLGFFRPELWFRDRDGRPVRVRLKDAEDLVQTRDYEGKRRLTLLQRQRWIVGPLAGRGTAEVKSLSIPVFDPQSSRWRSVGIRPSRAVPDLPRPARDPQSSAGRLRPELHGINLLTPVTIAFTVSCVALLAVVITGRTKRRP